MRRLGRQRSGWCTQDVAKLRLCEDARLGFTADLGPPPADANEEEAPVAEKFGRLAFEGVTDKLKDPTDYEQSQRPPPTLRPPDSQRNHEYGNGNIHDNDEFESYGRQCNEMYENGDNDAVDNYMNWYKQSY